MLNNHALLADLLSSLTSYQITNNPQSNNLGTNTTSNNNPSSSFNITNNNNSSGFINTDSNSLSEEDAASALLADIVLRTSVWTFSH